MYHQTSTTINSLGGLLPTLERELPPREYMAIKKGYQFIIGNQDALPLEKLKNLLPSLQIALRWQEYVAVRAIYKFMKNYYDQGYIIDEKTDTISLENILNHNKYYLENPEDNILLQLAIEIIKEF